MAVKITIIIPYNLISSCRMAMFKLSRLVDLTISNVMMRMTGFHPNMAVVASPCIQPSESKVKKNLQLDSADLFNSLD